MNLFKWNDDSYINLDQIALIEVDQPWAIDGRSFEGSVTVTFSHGKTKSVNLAMGLRLIEEIKRHSGRMEAFSDEQEEPCTDATSSPR